MSARSTAKNSFLITTGSIANVLLGLAFQLLLAQQLGLSPVVDVYTLGTMVPTLLATILIGSTPPVLVPAFTRIARTRADGKVPVRLVTTATVAVLGISVLVAVGSALATPLIGANLPPGQGDALTTFLVVTAVSIPLAWGAAVSQAILVLNERFLIVGLAGAANGVGLLVASLLVFSTGAVIPGLAISFVIGYLVQFIAQSIAARKHMAWDPAPPSAAIVRALAILLGSALIYKSQPIIERVLASYVAGGPAVLNYSSKVAQALLMASSLGLALISLPAISKHVSDDDYPRAFRFATGISLAICAISAPLIATAILASDSVVSVLYGRGAFGAEDINLVGVVLAISAAGIFFSAITGPMVNLLYATDRYRFVATVSIATTVGGGLLSWILRQPLGLGGIVLGSTVAFTVNYFIYWLAAAQRKSDGAILRTFLRPAGLVACVGIAAVLVSLIPVPQYLSGLGADIVRIAIVGIGSGAVSLALYLLMRQREPAGLIVGDASSGNVH